MSTKPLTHDEATIEAAIDLIAKSPDSQNVDSFAFKVLQLTVKGLLEFRANEERRAALKNGTSRWDTDPTTKPAAPWDEWDDYAGCWVCRSCGAAAGFGIHHELCKAAVPSPRLGDE